MERPMPPNPDHMTDEEFDNWLKAQFVALAKERGIWRED